MKNKKRIFIIGGIILAIVLLILILWFFLSGEKEQKKEVTVVDNIKEYGYTLDDNETSFYNKEFQNLKVVLGEETIDEEAYALSIAKLFVIDFFTLDNKLTKTDIGGIQFIHNDIKENLSKKASDTFYKYLENNLDGKRSNVYPIVQKFEKEEVSKISYTIKGEKEENDKTEDAYQVVLEWSYNKDTTYQKKAKFILIKEENKLSIVEIERFTDE